MEAGRCDESRSGPRWFATVVPRRTMKRGGCTAMFLRKASRERARGRARIAAAAGCLGTILVVVLTTPAFAAQRTTIPNVVVHVPVALTDNSLKIRVDKYTLGGTTRYPRGSIIDFMIKN